MPLYRYVAQLLYHTYITRNGSDYREIAEYSYRGNENRRDGGGKQTDRERIRILGININEWGERK